MSLYKDKISQSNVDEYSATLMEVMSIDTSSMLNAYRTVNHLNSESAWCKNVEIILKYVSGETYETIYDIVTGRINLFNTDNKNLGQLVKFLVNYIDISKDPDNVINVISSHFSNISNVAQLIHMLMDIEYDEDNACNKLAKFIDNSSVEEIIKIISDEWNADEMRKDKLIRVLSNSEKYAAPKLIHCIDENKENMNKNDILFMLEFCESVVTQDNMEEFLNIVKYLIDNCVEKDVYTQVLLRFSNIPKDVMTKHREIICVILVDIFRSSSSHENRRKCAVLIKEKGFARKIRGILEENELKEYKSYLS